MTIPKKKKVLIIDDEKPLLDIYHDKFSKEGFSVRDARNGQEGLEVAEKESPDIILLDILMPVMDGMTMLKKMRETDWGKDVPVIILSNLEDADKVAEAASVGVFDYLVKQNYKLGDLVDKVKEKLHM